MSEFIEEAIEESYLLGLSENEIRANLDRFIETCGRIIRENINDKKKMQDLAAQLAKARALSLIEDRQEGEHKGNILEAIKSSRERFAEKVARNKRLILRAIGECDPKLVTLIERERFPGGQQQLPNNTLPPKAKAGPNKTKNPLLKICFGITLIFVLLLIYVVLLQKI